MLMTSRYVRAIYLFIYALQMLWGTLHAIWVSLGILCTREREQGGETRERQRETVLEAFPEDGVVIITYSLRKAAMFVLLGY